MALLGNYLDQENDREVQFDDAQQWAIKNGFIHFSEISASLDIQCQEAFQTIARVGVKRMIEQAEAEGHFVSGRMDPIDFLSQQNTIRTQHIDTDHQ